MRQDRARPGPKPRSRQSAIDHGSPRRFRSSTPPRLVLPTDRPLSRVGCGGESGGSLPAEHPHPTGNTRNTPPSRPAFAARGLSRRTGRAPSRSRHCGPPAPPWPRPRRRRQPWPTGAPRCPQDRNARNLRGLPRPPGQRPRPVVPRCARSCQVVTKAIAHWIAHWPTPKTRSRRNPGFSAELGGLCGRPCRTRTCNQAGMSRQL